MRSRALLGSRAGFADRREGVGVIDIPGTSFCILGWFCFIYIARIFVKILSREERRCGAHGGWILNLSCAFLGDGNTMCRLGG